MGIFIGWLIFAFIVGFIGSDRKIGFWGAFLWSVLLSPLIGLIITLVSESNAAAKQREETKNLIKAQNELIRQQTEALKKIQDPNYLTPEEQNKLEKEKTISDYKEKYSKGEISLEELNNIENNIRGNYTKSRKESKKVDYLYLLILVVILSLILIWSN